MQQALLKYEQFDVFVVDEADDCILEHGAVIDLHKGQYIGFWDLMEKKTILLTATVGFDL
jgi:hypothetical protein